MKNEKAKKELAILSPSNISTTADFSGDVIRYRDMLDKMAELKGQREILFGKCKVFIRKYLKDKPYEGAQLDSLIEKIEVYKDKKKIEASDKAKRLAKHLKERIVDWVDNRAFMGMFINVFGQKAFEIVEEAAGYYHSLNDERELDEEATTKARREFEDLVTKFDETETAIKAQEIKIHQIKEYVSLYKDLASIASVGKRRKL